MGIAFPRVPASPDGDLSPRAIDMMPLAAAYGGIGGIVYPRFRHPCGVCHRGLQTSRLAEALVTGERRHFSTRKIGVRQGGRDLLLFWGV